ncbi:MAG: hypothetical protein JWQ71_983 [Pedosphaera sp.]|nr:hypothetical protein [Pedosphaera sp.]
MPRVRADEDKVWEWKGTEIFFRLIDAYPEGFTADEFYKACRDENFPPSQIRDNAARMFKNFAASGYIKKTGKFRLSERNGSSPLPVWVKREGLTRPACQNGETQ